MDAAFNTIIHLDDEGLHEITIKRLDGFIIGKLCVTKDTVEDIWVHRDYRRQGIATYMYRTLADEIGPIKHAGFRTVDGDLWAKSTGEEITNAQLD